MPGEIKFSALPTGTAITGADSAPGVQGGINVKQPYSAVSTYVLGNLYSAQTTNGVNYYNGSQITSGNNLTFDGAGILGLTNASGNVTFTIRTNNVGSGAGLQLSRPDTTSPAGISLFDGNTAKWGMGLQIGDDKFYFHDVASNLDRLIIDQSGNVNIPALTASLPVFTDISKNLTSAGVVPQANGGTNRSSGYVTSAVIFQDAGGGIFNSTANLTYNGSGLNVANNINITDIYTLNIASLSASQLVGTDGSKNLVSLSNGTLGQVLTSNGPGSLPSFAAPAVRVPYSVIAGTTAALVANQGFIATNASLSTFTLPSTFSVGDVFEVIGYGTGLVKIAQNAGQTVHMGNNATTTGATGFIQSLDANASFYLIGVIANTDLVISPAPQGNFSLT